jgi:hypothetical protein
LDEIALRKKHMLGFFKKKLPSPYNEASNFAIVEGQVMALHLVIGSLIDFMPPSERERLIVTLKTLVGRGFGGKAPFLLDDQLKQLYNNSMSATIQQFIENTEKPLT